MKGRFFDQMTEYLRRQQRQRRMSWSVPPLHASRPMPHACHGARPRTVLRRSLPAASRDGRVTRAKAHGLTAQRAGPAAEASPTQVCAQIEQSVPTHAKIRPPLPPPPPGPLAQHPSVSDGDHHVHEDHAPAPSARAKLRSALDRCSTPRGPHARGSTSSTENLAPLSHISFTSAPRTGCR